MSSILEKLTAIREGSLFEKLEALIEEATALVREERQRRNFPGVDLYGPRGTEIRLPSVPSPEPHPLINWGGNGTLDTPPIT